MVVERRRNLDEGDGGRGVFSASKYGRRAPFARRLWVVGGRTGSALQAAGDVWVLRKDGTWVAAPEAVTPRARHTVVTFNEKLFVIGGADGAQQYNDVWTIE